MLEAESHLHFGPASERRAQDPARDGPRLRAGLDAGVVRGHGPPVAAERVAGHGRADVARVGGHHAHARTDELRAKVLEQPRQGVLAEE